MSLFNCLVPSVSSRLPTIWPLNTILTEHNLNQKLSPKPTNKLLLSFYSDAPLFACRKSSPSVLLDISSACSSHAPHLATPCTHHATISLAMHDIKCLCLNAPPSSQNSSHHNSVINLSITSWDRINPHELNHHNSVINPPIIIMKPNQLT